MGRHSAPEDQRRKPVAPLAAAAALALAGLGGGGYAAYRMNSGDTAPAAASSSSSASPSDASGAVSGSDAPVTPAGDAASPAAPAGPVTCAKGSPVSVSTTPDMAPTLRAVAEKLSAQGSDCVQYTISELPAGVQADQVVEGHKAPPQIWVPDSQVWVDDYNDGTKSSVDMGRLVATSPVGLVLPKVYVDHGARPGPFTWLSMMQSRKHAVAPAMSDPEYSTSSMLLLASARKTAEAAGKQDAVKAEVLLMAENPRDERELMKLAASGSPLAKSFPASEQQMLAEHKAAPEQKVSAVTIQGSTPFMQYGVVPLAQDDAVKQAADALRNALLSPDGQKALTDAGFRVPGSPSEKAPSPVGGMDLEAMGPAIATPTHDEFEKTAAAWATVHRKMHMILAVDESGSMRQKAAPGLSRIQLATGISLEALKQLGDDTEVGVWAFSDQSRNNGKPWVEVAPITPLSKITGPGRTHRQDLVGVARKMPTMTGGGTALYDTILDAVHRVQESYDPSAVNSVVVWTDGVNRDAATMTKEQLLSQLRAVATSDKPVRVVLVGMGQASDMKTLQQIAQASGGSAYYAFDPAAVKSVIAGALSARLEQAGAAH